ncbi:MAG: hypothetical protein Rubg2KO_22480 [Rubricoccaceae bacterium]
MLISLAARRTVHPVYSMLRFLPAVALLLFACPALAQGTGTAPKIVLPDLGSSVDQAVIGTWELAEVEDGGLMAELGAEIDALVLRIEADGEALVELEVVQDRETMTKEDTFNCTTEDGQIRPDDRAAISYEVLGEDELRLTDPQGVIVRMKRAEPATEPESL